MKRVVGAAAFVLSVASALAFAPAARAQDTTTLLGSRHRVYESPQHFALELRFVRYRPQIDDDPALGGKTPYRDTFGTMPRLLLQVEFDWQAFRIPYVGTIGPGVAAGYTSMTDTAQRLDGSGPSGDDTNLEVFPFYAVAVFRADALMKNAGIPLVPYAKAGAAYAAWRAYTTAGTVTVDNVAGKGQSFGYHLAGGLAFQMDVLDARAQKSLDESVGVNHTYFFGEWMLDHVNGLRVGTSTWVLGLAFEF